MTDSDWVAYENLLKVTWYKSGICNVCGTKNDLGPLRTDNESLWIVTERRESLNSLMICVDCFEILKKLVEIVKEIPKAERSFDKTIVEENKRKSKLTGVQIMMSPNVWQVPDIQRRFLKEELK